MGTNFYWKKSGAVCPTCNRGDETELHIGKSSAGWCFSLHVYPEDGINDLADWLPKLLDPNSSIRDEYGREVEPAAMLRTIARRAYDTDRRAETHDALFLSQNHAEDGINGLLRHRVDRYCTRQGHGTWDCLVGEFS